MLNGQVKVWLPKVSKSTDREAVRAVVAAAATTV
ncbi:hypothetical protein SHIRM173S_01953 [Streptomyces hirsutus]